VKLPPLDNPQDYAGLFVYDFGDHVSVGYTAEEVLVLRADPRHRNGTAYRIHRVDEQGRLELEALSAERLGHYEGLLFASARQDRARAEYAALLAAARRDPPPCPARIELARRQDADPPFVLALIYPSPASPLIAAWLDRIAFQGGETVTGGLQALTEFRAAAGQTLSSAELPVEPRYAPRSPDQVLGRVRCAVQR